MASQGLSALLDLEEPKPRRSSTDRCGDPNAHPSNGPREPNLGSASHSRRVAHARLRGRRSYGVAVHAASAKTAVPKLAFVPPQPHPGPRFHRLLCRAHGHISRPVRLPHARTRSPTCRAFQRHRGAIRPVDRSSNWSTPSLTTWRRSISFGTETRSMARPSFVACVQWGSSRS